MLRKTLRAVPALLLMIAFIPSLTATNALAAGKATCTLNSLKQAVCTVEGSGDSSPGDRGSSSSTAPVACTFRGRTIPCSNNLGYWSSARQCYVSPWAGPPLYGHLRSDNPELLGAVLYGCKSPTNVLLGTFYAKPSEVPYVGPSPEELAQQALASLDITAIEIGTTPPPGPDSMGIVGIPVWLWATNPGNSTTGSSSASASSGPINVTVTASLARIVWDMGDGTQVTCNGPGTPWDPSKGAGPSPTCGHIYRRGSANQPGQTYTITATSYWNVHWSGGGQTGTIPLNVSNSTQLGVGEIQVLRTR